MDITGLLTNGIGFVATLFSIVMWMPQARITWRNRNDAVRLAGVSETTQWLSMIGYLLWGVFGMLIGSFWVAAPSVVSFPLSLATIVVVRRARRMSVPAASVSIISMSEPLSETNPTDAVPILTTGSIPVIAAGSDHSTVTVPILSSPATPDTAGAPRHVADERTPTTPVPVLA
ncbi:PQ-loop repeat-containing protein [Cryobacterium tepidiphilum]|uniref:PQ-loop repeat-containing protein n=1 Tax=Cryobacterium tepidiphilum TaxID=2486026 RepID=A0A3M8LPE6_9MICO|nr:hypothetical protein [Cryobacterium tepidiphilum]RNE66732.1 hypothetical protein EEJ31_02815 [Cryobacterium tepidiphilum]